MKLVYEVSLLCDHEVSVVDDHAHAYARARAHVAIEIQMVTWRDSHMTATWGGHMMVS